METRPIPLRAADHRFARIASGVIAFTVALILACTPASADDPEPPRPALFDMTLEQLLNLKVDILHRHEEPLFHSPSAVYVVSQEDIRRSGLTTLPEVLRMVPGLHVARIDANKWAVSIRGFNSRFSPNLLVLMDGRTLYSPLFSGTYWDVQDIMLEDIERIEVIRGPGGSLWGSNAINGIINIITKSAAATQGTLVSGGAGVEDTRAMGAVRHGFMVEDVAMRVYGKYHLAGSGEILGPEESANDGMLPVGSEAADDWDRAQVGFRADSDAARARAWTALGNAYHGEFGQTRVIPPMFGGSGSISDDEIEANGANLLGRVTLPLPADVGFVGQAYLDYTDREDAALREERYTGDLDLQLDRNFATRIPQRWIGGAGYRETSDDTESTSSFGFLPESRTDQTLNAFLQSEFGFLEEQLELSLGTKVEHNDYTDWECQPSARAAYRMDETASTWASITRAVRVPSRADSDGAITVAPGMQIPLGNPTLDAEVLWAYEWGYRWMPAEAFALDWTVFYQDYDELITGTADTTAPQQNIGEAELYGTEFSVTCRLSEWWQLKGGYSYHIADDSAEPDAPPLLVTPEHMGSLRSMLNLTPHWQFDGALYVVDDWEQESAASGLEGVPGYERLDLRLAWLPTERFTWELVGQNLTDSVHAESLQALRLNTGVERSAYTKVTYTF